MCLRLIVIIIGIVIEQPVHAVPGDAVASERTGLCGIVRHADMVRELGLIVRLQSCPVFAHDNLFQIDVSAQGVFDFQGYPPVIPGNVGDACYLSLVHLEGNALQLTIHQHRMINRRDKVKFICQPRFRVIRDNLLDGIIIPRFEDVVFCPLIGVIRIVRSRRVKAMCQHLSLAQHETRGNGKVLRPARAYFNRNINSIIVENYCLDAVFFPDVLFLLVIPAKRHLHVGFFRISPNDRIIDGKILAVPFIIIQQLRQRTGVPVYAPCLFNICLGRCQRHRIRLLRLCGINAGIGVIVRPAGNLVFYIIRNLL